MNLALQNAWKHPRTTLSGVLSFIVGMSVLLSAQPQLSLGIPQRWLSTFAVVAAVAKLLLASLSKDTGREEAVDRNGKTEMVDSHETPDMLGDVAAVNPTQAERRNG